jgi:hypothetical protein
MSANRLVLLTACCLLPAACCGEAAAQSPRDKVSFADVRFGFTPGPHAGNPEEAGASFKQPLYKPGAWVPVYVHVVNNGKYDERAEGSAEVVVETLDSDDAANSYRVALPSMPQENPSAKVIAYTRPGTRYTDVTVRVVRKRDGRDLCQPDKSSHPGLDPQQVFYLAIGSKLPGIRLPGATANVNTMQSGSCEIGNISRVEDMPTLWFGYSAADLVILATSDRSFITGLLNDTAGRKAALAEWVRRGGKLLVLAGAHRDVLNGQGFEELNAVLPVDLTGAPFKAAELRPSFREFITETFDPLEGPIDVTRLTPRENRSARVIAAGPPEAGTAPLIVQGPYGLGRVTVVACDIDQPPFPKWKGLTNSRDQLPRFWEQLLRQAGPRVPANIQNQFGGRFVPRGIPGQSDEGDATLRNVVQSLENFEGVPVISFGWVALFILLYILVVGPIDYLFLKKVVKRLELTWITFPTVVVAVSAAAYFTAYALKGNDLRINKIDLVDIDLQTKQSYGRTCFSVFSPRIQNYTIGVEPAESWAGPPAAGGPDTLVTWFGAPKVGQRSLFRRSYEYEDRATALHGVPIQVWSTKNFQALWQAPFDKTKPPFTADLKHPQGKPDELIGTVTSQLPVELVDAILIYKGEVAQLGRLAPDAQRSISSQSRVKFSSWRANVMEGANVPAASGVPVASPGNLKVDLLFHEESIGSNDPHNGSMREVDESWRVSPENRDEAILVARVAPINGLTEELTQSPVTSCRLWLGELPTSGRPRPAIPGTMRQETYVRVYVPVAAK